MDLQWHAFYELGLDDIDDDHRHLLEIMQGVQQAVLAQDHARCVVLLEQLLAEAAGHFRREEELLEKAGFPGLAQHRQYHLQLLSYARNVKELCESVRAEHDLQLCFDGMARFLVDDILRGDLQFKSFLQEAGYIKGA